MVARWADFADPDSTAAFVHREVYGPLAHGVRSPRLFLKARELRADWPEPAADGAPYLGATQPGTTWNPSGNYNSRGGRDVRFVIIHTCEGSATGCSATLRNSQNSVSAHYVVWEDGSRIEALVDEDDRAWHIGATYDCNNNSADVDGSTCWLSGTSSNTLSVGIEHGGYASTQVHNATMISESAKLLCGIATRHGIPLDREHILAHGELQPWNRTDPGAGWPWTDYLNQARAACGQPALGADPLPADARVIDNDNANNPSDVGFEASASWTSSSNVPGFWEDGYRWAPTESISDTADFWFETTGPTCYDVRAWWTAGTDRHSAATYLAWDGAAATSLGQVAVDQRTGGSTWHPLGTWLFPDGTNRIRLSRWAGEGSVVVADAVALVPTDTCPGLRPCPDAAFDADDDGVCDAYDGCPDDGDKEAPGDCGCGEPEVAGCPGPPDTGGDTGALDTASPDPNTPGPGPGSDDTPLDPPGLVDDGYGCQGCAGTGSFGGVAWLGLLGLALRRRR